MNNKDIVDKKIWALLLLELTTHKTSINKTVAHYKSQPHITEYCKNY